MDEERTRFAHAGADYRRSARERVDLAIPQIIARLDKARYRDRVVVPNFTGIDDLQELLRGVHTRYEVGFDFLQDPTHYEYRGPYDSEAVIGIKNNQLQAVFFRPDLQCYQHDLFEKSSYFRTERNGIWKIFRDMNLWGDKHGLVVLTKGDRGTVDQTSTRSYTFRMHSHPTEGEINPGFNDLGTAQNSYLDTYKNPRKSPIPYTRKTFIQKLTDLLS